MSSRLLRLAGLDVATENGLPSVVGDNATIGLNDGIIALTEGSVDVLFWSAGHHRCYAKPMKSHS